MILINKQSLKLADLAPKQESRYPINAINITQHETVATDGHMLIRVSHPKANISNFPMVEGFDAGKDFESILLPKETEQGMTAILMPIRKDGSQYPYAYKK